MRVDPIVSIKVRKSRNLAIVSAPLMLQHSLGDWPWHDLRSCGRYHGPAVIPGWGASAPTSNSSVAHHGELAVMNGQPYSKRNRL
jgi:hypothetical protein